MVAVLVVGAVAMAGFMHLACKCAGSGPAGPRSSTGLFCVRLVPPRRLPAAAPADRPRWGDDRPADLPADGARVQRHGGGPVPRPALAQHVRRGPRGREAGRAPPPSSIVRLGFALLTGGMALLLPVVPRADSGWALLVPLIVAGSGLGLLVSQLNNYTLSPISEERVSEAAGVNSAAGSFGLSFGLAFAGAIMLATLSFTFTDMADDSTVLSESEKAQVADVLEEDAEVMSTTQLEELLVGQPDRSGRDRRHQHRRPTPRPPGGAPWCPSSPGSSGRRMPSAWPACRTRPRRPPPRACSSAERDRLGAHPGPTAVRSSSRRPGRDFIAVRVAPLSIGSRSRSSGGGRGRPGADRRPTRRRRARSAPTWRSSDAMSSARSVASRRSDAASSLKPKSISHTSPSSARNRLASRRSRCAIRWRAQHDQLVATPRPGPRR